MISARVNGGGMEVGSVKIPDPSKWGLMSKNSDGKAVLETVNVEKVRQKMQIKMERDLFLPAAIKNLWKCMQINNQEISRAYL